ncbi:MAG TPA: PKD domain-containing protein [Bacteroidales bacterium]|nr:PKD domain-containing protein [Bacteroidales bacterium]
MKRFLYIILILTGALTFTAEAQKPSIYKVSKMSFSESSFSDISPVIVQNGILFCSNRRFSAIEDRTSFNGTRLYNIYIAQKLDSVQWGKPVMVDNERVKKFNNGPLSIGSDGRTVYFTSEVETGKAAKKKKFRNHNGIFIGELSGNQLGSLKPFRYNSNEYEVAHPSVSHDGKYLFFASNMPGGLGKSDIYYCENVNGEWSAPVNMGPRINTTGTENYPYMHPSGRLYFSSDRAGGMGKLDVYMTSKYNGEWDAPALLPDPINSASDDFAFMADENLQTGYFSSNRTFDDDIFRFTSTIIRKLSCNELIENSYCYRFTEENAIKYDTVPFRYIWNFGDGNKAEGAVVEHCFPGPGKYVVNLDVVNLITKEVINNEKTDTVLVEDEIQPYITGPETTSPGKPVKLDALKTNLPGWNIASYYWNFGDETIATGSKVDKTFTRPGTYNIQLIVSEGPQPGGVTREECVSKNIIVLPEP